MRPRLKETLLLLLAFGMGVIGGAMGFGVYHARFSDWRTQGGSARFEERILSRLTKELDLRSDQRQKVEAVLEEARNEFAKLREEIGPKFRDIRNRTRDSIRSALDAAQQVKFDKVAQEWERRAERWRDRARPTMTQEVKATAAAMDRMNRRVPSIIAWLPFGRHAPHALRDACALAPARANEFMVSWRRPLWRAPPANRAPRP